MLCQECRKRQATVHITRIVNGHKTEMVLCEQCAKEKGELEMFAEPQFPLQSFLASLLEQGGHAAQSTPAIAARCSNCGLTYRDFARTGRLGCSQCYSEFGGWLDPVLRRIHGTSKHTGKVPARTGGTAKIRKSLNDLREALSRAVQSEEFEKAAGLRDEIRRLEKELE